MQQRTIGHRTVGAIGLGGMPMSIEGRPDKGRSIATIHAALDAGVTHIDTADSYHLHAGEVGHNEELIATALKSYGRGASEVLIASKGGHLRPGDGSWTLDGRPEHVIASAKSSAQRLGVDAIGLYYYHRPDPKVPYADGIGAIKQLLDEGVIEMAGISNANVHQIDEARGILGDDLVAVQNKFSPAFQDSLIELEYSTSLGLAFLAYSPLGGIAKAASLGCHSAFQSVADDRGVSPQQIALAWELAHSQRVIPIPGASRPSSVLDSSASANVVLHNDELAKLAGRPD